MQPFHRLLFAACLAGSPALFAQAPPAKEEPKWPRHSMERPRPPVVEPKYDGKPVAAPAGAVILFDGTSLEAWKSRDQPAKWRLADGFMEVVAGTGPLKCQIPMKGDGHLHLEWATPSEVKGSGQGRGNSGVFIEGFPEVQVLDSYQNDTYPDGQAAALYGIQPPLANACRKPGEWQTYDIVIQRAKVEDGKVVRKARLSVTHNGVLVQDAVEIDTKTESSLLEFQDHGNPMRFRNIWFKPAG
jgi:hypothetical protein